MSKDSARRPDATPNENVSNGYYYIKAGTFHALISGNTKEVKATTGGVIDPSIAQITPCRFYESDFNCKPKRVYLAPIDRLYLTNSSILVTHSDLQEASISGVDSLKFPVVEVLDLVDSNGQDYTEADYDVKNGQIVWKDGRPRPGWNMEAGKGQVYSIRYLYQPYWYIHRIIHEIRVVQTINDEGESDMIQAPQSAIVAREFVHQDQIGEMGKKPTDRTVEAPASV